MTEPSAKKRRVSMWIALSAIVLAGIVLALISSVVCLPAWIAKGVAVPECPDGQLRQTLRIGLFGAQRGGKGQVTVSAIAHYTTGDMDGHLSAPVRRRTVRLALVDPKGEERAIEPVKSKWQDEDEYSSAEIELPVVPDGDYQLRARVRTPIEESTIDLPLALYAPARIHVITDRPLYQPGQTVQFRAVALRAHDLSTLDGRPGKWVVTDPSGETVLEEKAPAGDWGIVSGSFPLDKQAATGSWSVAWVSGDAQEQASFTVEPFTLPRFRVEAEASRAFYLPTDVPRVRGTVHYSSGAPVQGAEIEITWSVSGAWPPPTSWLEGGLPNHARADKSGAFELVLPAIPTDLIDQATLFGRIAATDPAGDRVEGSVSLLLSHDPIRVTAVTELGDGLVEGFNNRLYLRATTASGVPLPKTKLFVRRAWEPNDPGLATETDEDGVAALQVDPGPAVNVVVPPPPYRPPPKEPAASMGEAYDLVSGTEPSLADRRAMDVWPRALESCARFADEEAEDVSIAIRVDARGAIVSTSDDGKAITRCVTSVLKARLLSPGPERLYKVDLSFSAADLPSVSADVEGAPYTLDELTAQIQAAAKDARSCLPEDVEESDLPRALLWRTKNKEKDVTVSWVTDRARRSSVTLGAAKTACVEAKLSKITLAEPANADTLGIARLSAHPSPRAAELRPQATTMLGYELEIRATAGEEKIGSTKLRIEPGAVPPVRLRATPVIAQAGDPIDVEIIRGPGFSGSLPEKLWLTGRTTSIESKVDKDKRRAQFALPKDAKGWYEVNWSGARVVIFVRDDALLDVAVRPERDRYAPGELAKILVETRVAKEGTPAAVGLIGVDESLGQLAPLPGPDELARLRPKVETPSPAFGVIDGQALAMGRIRGANAAQAAVLRVGTLPSPAAIDVVVNANTEGRFDPNEALTDRFYTALSELHSSVRRWEKEAPPEEQMKPATMAKLWDEALASLEKQGTEVRDAFGRKLRLSHLPSDLLALTAPTAVVVKGTRLPEDVEDWASWVQREQP
jgi:hypothetical protein